MSTNNAQQPVRQVKTIKHIVRLDSEQLFNYLGEEGGKSRGALERIGSLLRMLAKDESLSLAVNQWLASVFDEANKEVDMLLAQKEKLEENVDMSMFEVHIPDTYVFNIEVAHPSVWKLIKLIQRIDIELNSVENFWLAGEIDDVELNQAKMQALAIARRVIHKIFAATSPGKRDDGGQFSPMKFINIMRQVKGMPDIELKIKAKEQEIRDAKKEKALALEVKQKTKVKPKAKTKVKPKAKTKSKVKPKANVEPLAVESKVVNIDAEVA